MGVMYAASSLISLISSPHHGFGCTKHASSWGLHAKVNYVARFGVNNVIDPKMTTTFRKPLMMLECKNKGVELVSDLGLGSLVKGGYVFRQNIYIRSFETGPDRKALVESLMNYLQETACNHTKAFGVFHDGMSSTLEMNKRSLIWVQTKLHVAVDHYPTWGDIVQIDTWNATAGTYGVRCNWVFRDCKTDKILIRASNILMMMNKKTRRLSRIPNEVQAELKQIFADNIPFTVEDNIRKWSKLDENTSIHVRNGITPKWSDLDANQHVNNVKYIGWILESVPRMIMEKYELVGMTLEYRRECRKDNVVQCHTYVSEKSNDGIADYDHVDCQHLLQLEGGGGGGGGGLDGDEILKGRTKWRPKYGK